MSADAGAAPAPAGGMTGGSGPRPAPAPALEPVPATPGEAATHPPGAVVLEVKDLRTYFFTYGGVVKALDGVTFELRRGETTGLVGETGCGKSVTAFSITRLVPDPPGRIVGGQVLLRGADLLKGLDKEAKFHPVKDTPRVRVSRSFRRIRAANERMESVRGRRISMIFQEPTQALNPVFSISNQIGEIIFLHHGIQIIDEMLGATPGAPGVEPALRHLLAAIGTHNTAKVREAATALGVAARSSRLGTEAFYIGQAAVRPSATRRQLERAIARLRIRSGQRRYLRHRRRLLEIRERLNELRLIKLQVPLARRGVAPVPTSSPPAAPATPGPGPTAPRPFGPVMTPQPATPPKRRPRGDLSHVGSERALQSRMAVARLSHFYYGVWGIRGRVRKALDDELFWKVVHILEGVQIANAPQVARGYPHELSGGMLQRAMIAMALSAEPDILLADEPTTALDVTIQAQILTLLEDLRKRVGTAILLITHDLAVIAEVADHVCVMYAGQIVEQGPVRDLFRRPLHPYTQGLLGSVPRVDRPDKELHSIAGSVPGLIDPPSGCRFHPRCPHAMPICSAERPPVTDEGSGHTVACYLYHGTRVGAEPQGSPGG